MNIIINKHLFATYCGMIKSGYPLMDLSDKLVSDICKWIHSIDFGDSVIPYFLFAKTDCFPVNPYYPRGSDLSAACFFLDCNIDEFIDFLHLCESPEAGNKDFIAWIQQLPSILECIEQCNYFDSVFRNYCMVVNNRFSCFSDQMSEITQLTKTTAFRSPVTVSFAPNLLQAKFLADYALSRNTLYVISGEFKQSAIFHEYLHIAMKPIRSLLQDAVRQHGIGSYFDSEKMFSLGYLRGNSTNEHAHALEECIVRALCGVTTQIPDLAEYCQDNLRNGFVSVPKMIDRLSNIPLYDMSLDKVVLQTIFD